MTLNAGYVNLSGIGNPIVQMLSANPNRKRVLITNLNQQAWIGASGLSTSGGTGSGKFFEPLMGQTTELTDTDSIWILGLSGTFVSFVEENKMPTLPDIQVFNSGSWTWTKPAGAAIVEILLVGGGQGGDGGASLNSGAQILGGFGSSTGGGGGGWNSALFPAQNLGQTERVVVGYGGQGGSGGITDPTGNTIRPGSAGILGGITSFGTTINLTNQGGEGIYAGAAGGAGAAPIGTVWSASGFPGNSGGIGDTGGHAGGGISGMQTGGSGTSVQLNTPYGGGGGGGGGSVSGLPGGIGGNGGLYGAGGGAGGIAINGWNGGNGGIGAPGVAVVISW